MYQWIYDRRGVARILLYESERFINPNGTILGWLEKDTVFNLTGQHLGWYENGVLYDSANRTVGFVDGATGYLPSNPGRGSCPSYMSIGSNPGKPDFTKVPTRPAFGDWSDTLLQSFFHSER